MIKFIGFLPGKGEHFISMVMLLVGSIVEITYLSKTKGPVTEAVLIAGATEDMLYFSRRLAMQQHAWIFRRMAEDGSFTGQNYAVEWDQIKSIVYIGNYQEANEYLVSKAYA